MTEKVTCPICKSEAEAINIGLFDGIGVRSKTHGELEVSLPSICKSISGPKEGVMESRSRRALSQRPKLARRHWETPNSFSISAIIGCVKPALRNSAKS